MTDLSTPFRIIIDFKRLQIRELSEAVVGPICMMIDGHAYPHKDWDDFPIVILEWWLRSFTDALQVGDEFSFEFMDTPDKCHFVRASADSLHFEYVSGNETRAHTKKATTCLWQDVAAELSRAGKAVLEHCQAQHITGSDTERLEASFHRFSSTNFPA